MQTLNAEHWEQHVPEVEEGKEGDVRSCRFVIPAENAITFEVRSSEVVTLNAVTKDGLTLFLDRGSVILFSAKMVGFAFFEVLCKIEFMYRSTMRSRWFEIPDQTRLTVDIDESASKPLADMIREEVLRLYGQEQLNQVMSDMSLEELIDDIQNGDLDFEEEPDPFGLGAVEMEEVRTDRPAEPSLPPEAASGPVVDSGKEGVAADPAS